MEVSEKPYPETSSGQVFVTLLLEQMLACSKEKIAG